MGFIDIKFMMPFCSRAEKSQPKTDIKSFFISLSISSVVMYTPGSFLFTPSYMKLAEKSVLQVPALPAMRTTDPGTKPPSSLSSKPLMPVVTLSIFTAPFNMYFFVFAIFIDEHYSSNMLLTFFFMSAKDSFGCSAGPVSPYISRISLPSIFSSGCC